MDSDHVGKDSEYSLWLNNGEEIAGLRISSYEALFEKLTF